MTTIYTGECSDCGTEHRREWKTKWIGPDGENSYAADCRVCGPGFEIHMSPDLPDEDEPEGDLRSRIGKECVVSVMDDEGEFTVEVAYDGIEIEHSIEADREEAVAVALAGLRVDWVRREIRRGTATAADVRMAIDEAEVCGWDGEDVTDLEEAFMLLADEDELDAYREAKLRRLADAMEETEKEHRANPVPVLVDVDERAA